MRAETSLADERSLMGAVRALDQLEAAAARRQMHAIALSTSLAPRRSWASPPLQIRAPSFLEKTDARQRANLQVPFAPRKFHAPPPLPVISRAYLTSAQRVSMFWGPIRQRAATRRHGRASWSCRWEAR